MGRFKQAMGLSNGTGAQINVPEDMGQQLFNTFGPAYGIE